MPTVKPEVFFDEPESHSLVKASIVSSYFDSWAKIICGTQDREGRGRPKRLGYVDLFAGPGHYASGAPSTPLLVLAHAIARPQVADRLESMFNDTRADLVAQLEGAVKALPGYERLKHPPRFSSEEVGDATAEKFAKIEKIPLLAFIDPFGYKGLTLKLLTSLLDDWGGDGIFFFNYNRINMGITNNSVASHIDALFGPDRASALRDHLPKLSPQERERVILENLEAALRRYGHYLLPFTFKNEAATKTTHHLIFVSKHPKGYEVMKDIMAKASSTETQGVPSYTYFPKPEYAPRFLFDTPLDDLREDLLAQFSGRTLACGALIQEHFVGKPYLPRNYKQVLLELREAGAIKFSREPLRKGTLADEIEITFE